MHGTVHGKCGPCEGHPQARHSEEAVSTRGYPHAQ